MYFIIAVLAGLGVGSGGLLISFLTLVSDMPQDSAAGVNLVFFVAALFASVVVSVKNKKLGSGFFTRVVPTGALGAIVGSLLSMRVTPGIVRATFGVFMIVAGSMTLVSAANMLARDLVARRRRKKENAKNKKEISDKT